MDRSCPVTYEPRVSGTKKVLLFYNQPGPDLPDPLRQIFKQIEGVTFLVDLRNFWHLSFVGAGSLYQDRENVGKIFLKINIYPTCYLHVINALPTIYPSPHIINFSTTLTPQIINSLINYLPSSHFKINILSTDPHYPHILSCAMLRYVRKTLK